MDAQADQALTEERRTHGSDQRAARDLSVPLRRFDVAELGQRLFAEPAFATDGRNAETIHDDGAGRVMVGVVDSGRDIGANESDGFVTISWSEGRGMLRRGEETVEVAGGSTVILAPGATWAYEATEPSVFLATFWPRSA